MPKIVKTDELPDKPEELYVKLYCERIGSSTSDIRKRAAQSWISLSQSKKKHFIRICRHKQKVNLAQRIQSTEPFLKQLPNVTIDESDSEASTHNGQTLGDNNLINNTSTVEVNLNNNHSINDTTLNNNQTVTEASFCIDKSIHELNKSEFDEKSKIEDNAIDCDLSATINDTNLLDDKSALQNSINNLTKEINGHSDDENECNDNIKTNNECKSETNHIEEPSPPTVMTYKDLFFMLNKDPTKTLKNLQPHERSTYQFIIKKIRAEYIEKYIKYLESLSSKELYEHYLKQS